MDFSLCLLGSFMCEMVCTRHDIANAMGVVNQFMVNLGRSHCIAMKWIFHYLKCIMDFGLCFIKKTKMLSWQGAF